MAFHRPIPDSSSRSKLSTSFGTLVEAEKLMQVAFVLPSAVVICWFIGWWLAGRTHQKWLEIAGIVLGCIVGLVYVIQMAISVEKKTSVGDNSPPGTGKGSRTGKS